MYPFLGLNLNILIEKRLNASFQAQNLSFCAHRNHFLNLVNWIWITLSRFIGHKSQNFNYNPNVFHITRFRKWFFCVTIFVDNFRLGRRKTTAIRRTTAQETCVSRHYGGIIEGILKPLKHHRTIVLVG